MITHEALSSYEPLTVLLKVKNMTMTVTDQRADNVMVEIKTNSLVKKAAMDIVAVIEVFPTEDRLTFWVVMADRKNHTYEIRFVFRTNDRKFES